MIEAISVFGLGKLGAPMAACFAAKGFRVVGVDVDERKVQAINRGEAPIFEPRLSDIFVFSTCWRGFGFLEMLEGINYICLGTGGMLPKLERVTEFTSAEYRGEPGVAQLAGEGGAD
jgi:hypothetical protein